MTSKTSTSKGIRLALFAGTASLLASGPLLATPYFLSNGTGDGAVTVGVDGFGSFGSSVSNDTTDANYNPVGPLDAAGTVYESALFFSGSDSWLSTGFQSSLDNPVVSGTTTTANSSFSADSLDFSLQQSLVDSFDSNNDRVGTALNQQYTITNNGSTPTSFALTRYVDGDLEFDSSISDGGGLLEVGSNRILYETDAASGSAASTTFVGITSSGGIANPAGAYEIDSFNGLRSRISEGTPLDNTINGDNDGDNFIDAPYDVTLALSNVFELDGGASVTYSTTTLFGNAVPPAPGSSEALPLLPATDEPPFIFDITPPDDGSVVWIDPIIAVGYEYVIESGNNLFDAVVMPSMATVPQVGEYELLTWDGSDWIVEAMLSPGESYDFLVNPIMFRIAEIDVGLALDPNDGLAFPIGVAFETGEAVTVSQTPLTFDTDQNGGNGGNGGNNVPLPGVLPLLAIGLFGLIGIRHRRHA